MILRAWDSPTLTTWTSLGTNFLRFFSVLPLVLRQFTVEEVAVWYLMGTLAQLLWYLDFGLSTTASRYFAYATAGASSFSAIDARGSRLPNEPLIRTLFKTLRTLLVPMGLGVGLLIGLIGGAVLSKPIAAMAAPEDGWIAWLIMLAGSTAAFVGMLYSSYLEGGGRIAVVRRWEALMNIGAIASSIAVLLFDGTIVGLALTNQTWVVLGVVRNRWLVHRNAPAGLIGGSKMAFDADVFRTLWQSAWRSGTGVLLNSGAVRLSAAILAQRLDPATLAAYLLAFNLLDRLNQFAMAPFYSKLPAMAAHYTKGEWTVLERQAKKGGTLTLSIFVAAALAFGIVATPLLQAIGSSTPFIGLPFWLLITLAMTVHRYGAMHLQVYTLSNHVVWHVADGVSGVLFLATWLALFHWTGVFAIPLGMLVAYGFFYTPFSVLRCRGWWHSVRIQREAGAIDAVGG